jgi:4-amino-4-deoxy-L-arabinose transferase-like glycosyltransferase
LILRFWGAIPIALAAALLVLRSCVVTPPLANLRVVPSDPRDPPGTVARAGSVWIARGGPVRFGFMSSGLGRLTVAGNEIVGRNFVDPADKEGHHRIVLPAGPVAIRIAAPDVRLIWNPVGRRGDPEYVQASSLSPEPPERATFGPFAGAAPLDGAIALALLVLLVGSLCMLARARLRAVPRVTWIAMGAVFTAACLVRWLDLSGFGETWDEGVYWASGRNYVTNWLSLDFRAESWRWNFEHPPVMKYLAGIGAQFSDGFGPARAMSTLWVALGGALLVPIGARLYRLRVGVLAATIAALLPPLIAHGQIVGHESPTVLWWSLGVLLALGVHDDLPDEVYLARRHIRRRLAWIGVVVGVAFASRFINGLLGPLCVAIAALRARPAWWRQTLVDGLWIVPCVAGIVLYVVWPRLWPDPLFALSESFAKLDHGHGKEPFVGVMTDHPARYYFLVYLAATLPVGVLAGVGAYVVRAARERDRRALIVTLWFVLPLGVALSPVRQDGVRYVMPCVVALAFAAAAGFDTIATALDRRVRHAFVAIAGAVALYLVIVLARVHPYYLDYFGEQVGGPATVTQHGWFETAWWGEGVDRAVAYVNEHAEPGAHVFNCVAPSHLTWYRQDLWQAGTPTWFVVYSPATNACSIPRAARRVFTVEAQDAVLAEVWTTAPLAPPASASTTSGDR